MTATSPFRVRLDVDRAEFGDDQWHRARLDFDFRRTETAFYSIFAPRLNEGGTDAGPAHLLIKNVRLIAYEAN
jgi:hypothetical protein